MAREAIETVPSRPQSSGESPRTNALGTRLPWRVLGLVLCLLFLLVSAASNFEEARYIYLAPMTGGDLGAQLVRDVVGPHEVEVRNLQANSPLAVAGIRNGDRLRLDHPWDDLRTMPAGEQVGFTWLKRERAQHVVIVVPTVVPTSLAQRFSTHVNLLANTPMLLLGAFMFWRGRRQPGISALSMALVINGAASPYRWPQSASEYPLWHVLINLGFTLVPWLLLFFTLDYLSRYTRRPRAWEWRGFAAMVCAQILLYAADVQSILFNNRAWYAGTIALLSDLTQMVGVVASFIYLYEGLSKSTSDQRKRYGLIIAALAMVFLPVIAFVLTTTLSLSSGYRYDTLSPVLLASWVSQGLGAFLFVYVIFRHKVFDVGFVINRTLIYAVISTGLLVTFGLIEWVSERLLPYESIEASAVVNAAVALGIFLVFHHLRDTVERLVQRLLFRSWHENEAQLRQFAKEAAFFGKAEALGAATATALSRFAGGADVAAYFRNSDDFICRQGGVTGVPAQINADDPVAVILRLHRTAVEPSDTNSQLAAALALPMIHGAALDGFFLLGSKPSGDSYRPDEINVLATTVQQIGLDLHAFKVIALEAHVLSLEERNSELRGLVACIVTAGTTK